MSIEFGPRALEQLRVVLNGRGIQRALVLTGPSRRFVEILDDALDGVELEVFDAARVHVPSDVVQDATRALAAAQPRALIALGGGAAIGLGKALRLHHDLPFFAVPTTYSGSEQTSIHGVTDGRIKTTGRDPKVRPDGVYYVPAFFAALPRAQKIKSLLNALAHPVSTLTRSDGLDPEEREQALDAVKQLMGAILQLAETSDDERAQTAALRASACAGAVLETGKLGVHHQIAHYLGGRFDVEHAGLHAVLLPQTLGDLASTRPERYAELEKAAGMPDLPGQVFDLLRRVEGPTGLKGLGLELEALEAALAQEPELPRSTIRAAYHGRRPSTRVRSVDWGLREPLALAGAPLESAHTVAVCVHGRGATAESILGRFFEVMGHGAAIAAVAPQARDNVWFSHGYRDSPETMGEDFEAASTELAATWTRVRRLAPRARLVFFGFSQGGCLGLEALARADEVPFDAVVAVAGARMGPREGYGAPSSALAGVPVLLGVAEEDGWVDAADVAATAAWLEASGARPEVMNEAGEAHQISWRQRLRARELVRGRTNEFLRGFGVQESQALPEALPRRGNSPRRAPYGLYAEQINQSGFVADREHNRRAWTYRVRPTAQHGRFVPLEGSRVDPEFSREGLDPNLVGYAPLPIPETPTDFVDGLATYGGAGHPELRRGFAIHLYSANRSMSDRSFHSSDGELLIVPETGALTLLTEFGPLEAGPGRVVIVPRGVRFSVQLHGSAARGYVAEIYGRVFELPDRGPVGANGLTDERHFVAPSAWYEDRLAPGFEIVNKYAGRLFTARQDYSPFDVVAWHGNMAPRVYDLMDFSPVGNTRFDHPDPSIYTVLSAPLDERGAHLLDFVFFPPRWDVTEDTFRPPFFHRNATTEINGIIRDPSGDSFPFYAGGWFVTPAMTPHGVRTGASQQMFLADEDPPASRTHERSMWFQFESALPLGVTAWGRGLQDLEGWSAMWGSYPTHFDPERV